MEYVILYCPQYEAERRGLIMNLIEFNLNYDLHDLLQINYGEKTDLFLL